MKNYIVATIIFLPMIVLFFFGKEFWPMTSFPMYSQPYKSFNWPRVFVKPSSGASWQALISEKCYGRIGYVRFHFSVLRFSIENRQSAINDLATALTKEIRLQCQDLDFNYLKISIFNLNIDSRGLHAEKFIKNLTEDIAIEI